MRLAVGLGVALPVACAAALVAQLAFDETGCSVACSGACPADEAAEIDVACPTSLTAVSVTGPCATGDASNPGAYGYTGASLFIWSGAPGVCHVTLTFADGSTYSTDVEFAARPPNAPANAPACGTCPPVVAPAQSTIAVERPDAACADAGGPAGDAAGGGADL